jgi:hypothetical protein
MKRILKSILTYCLNAYFVWATCALFESNTTSIDNHIDYNQGKLPQESIRL